MLLPSNFQLIKDEPDGEDLQGQDELEELRKNVQGEPCEGILNYKF